MLSSRSQTKLVHHVKRDLSLAQRLSFVYVSSHLSNPLKTALRTLLLVVAFESNLDTYNICSEYQESFKEVENHTIMSSTNSSTSAHKLVLKQNVVK